MSVTIEAPVEQAEKAERGEAAEDLEDLEAVEAVEAVEATEAPEALAADDKPDDKPADDKAADDKGKAKPRRKTAPRKAAATATKALVVLREGRVHYADAETVVVVDLDEAASPDTDVHDVLDRLTELRDAVECPGKADAVRALTDLIQEKALG